MTPTKKPRALDRRPGARQRGYDSKWEKETRAFLALPENRLCSCGCGQHADMVDHIQAHKGDKRLFWDRSNWQPMNRRCNSRKAARLEGGFGNAKGKGGYGPAGCKVDGTPLDRGHWWNRS